MKENNVIIREMMYQDRQEVISMMKVFYASPAVLSNGSIEIFNQDVDACVNDNPLLEGYVFEKENEIVGYAMVAKSFSTEYGKICIWIEDLYMKESFRGQGIGTRFFALIEEKYPDTIIKLEVEEENNRAINMYQKCGYEILEYLEMRKLNKNK